MRREVERVVAPFINSFGHIINPGDHVIKVTTRQHRTSISKTEYIGYVERDGEKYAQVRCLGDKYISTLLQNRILPYTANIECLVGITK